MRSIVGANEQAAELSMLCGFDDDLTQQSTATSNQIRAFSPRSILPRNGPSARTLTTRQWQNCWPSWFFGVLHPSVGFGVWHRDSAETARHVAVELGITRVRAECLPADKVAELAGIAERPVIMVGDGVNDAPVLAAADVGIAMGAKGATAARIAASADSLAITQEMVDLATILAALRAIGGRLDEREAHENATNQSSRAGADITD